MNRPARFSALAVAMAGMVLGMSGCNRLAARDQLNKGVEAYKSTRYEEAIGHFQKATELDPTLPMAKTYLATALAMNVVPGLDTPDNIKTAQKAIGIFQEVLAKDPDDVNSIKQIAGIYFSIKKLDDAKDWQNEHVLKALGAAGATDDGEGNAKAPKKAMEEIKQENTPLIDEGLQYLTQAEQIRANYDDAMVYLNLIYRRKADLDFGNDAARKADIAKAEDWRAKAMGTRKQNEEKKNAGPGGITMDSSGNLK